MLGGWVSVSLSLVITHLCAALDHSDCMAKLPVLRCTLPSGSGVPNGIPPHTHLSPISPPKGSLKSHQPPPAVGSVIDSAYSCPPTIEKPSSMPGEPELMKFSPHPIPASSWYGRFV